MPEDLQGQWLQAVRSFNDSTGRLRQAYQALQVRVEALTLELEETNRELLETIRQKEELRAHLFNILEGLPVGVLVGDLRGRLSLANRAARDWMLIRGEGMKESLLELLAPWLPREEVSALVAPPTEGVTLERRVKNEDGLWRYLKFRGHRLSDAGMEGIGVLITLEDTTELRFMEEEVARGQRLAAMGEMATSIAHEVKNPLSSIQLFAGLMAEETSNEVRREFMRQIKSVIDSVDRMLSNLLTFAKPLRPNLKGIDPREVLEECLDFVRPLAQQRGVGLDLSIPHRVPLVRGDRDLLKQALLNVLLNAFQAMPQGGSVRAWVRLCSSIQCGWGPVLEKEHVLQGGTEWVEIGVQDTGEGIAPDLQQRVFDPFFTTRSGGSGLGLSIVHGIVKAHSGSVRLQSELGEGTCVSIRLPTDQQWAARERRQSRDPMLSNEDQEKR